MAIGTKLLFSGRQLIMSELGWFPFVLPMTLAARRSDGAMQGVDGALMTFLALAAQRGIQNFMGEPRCRSILGHSSMIAVTVGAILPFQSMMKPYLRFFSNNGNPFGGGGADGVHFVAGDASLR
ncbi:MAG: hypothetical protein HW380_1539 [Magnetococcales bacterium]|nr:hypothetical protein [Magnetococcales bacterium]